MRLRFDIKSLLLVTLAVAIVTFCALPTEPLTYRDGVDKAEAKRVFRIAKPLIDHQLGGNTREMRYHISSFDGGWFVMAGHKELEMVASGWQIFVVNEDGELLEDYDCLLYTSPSPRDATLSRMPSSA